MASEPGRCWTTMVLAVLLWSSATLARGPRTPSPGPMLLCNERNVAAVAISPDGMSVATAAQNVQLWDADSGFLKFALMKRGGNTSLRFSPDGAMLATYGRESSRIQVWDARAGRLKRTLIGPAEQVLFVSNRPAVITADDHQVRLWSLTTGRARILSGATDPVAVSSDGRWLATARRTGACVWNLNTLKTIPLRGFTSELSLAAFSPRNNLLATGSTLRKPDRASATGVNVWGTLRLWVPRTGALVRTLQGTSMGSNGDFQSLAWSHDGSRLASDWALWGGGGEYKRASRTTVWNIPSSAVVLSLLGESQPALSVDGRLLATAHQDWLEEPFHTTLWNFRDRFSLPSDAGAPIQFTSERRLFTGPVGNTGWAAARTRVRAWDVSPASLRLTEQGCVNGAASSEPLR